MFKSMFQVLGVKGRGRDCVDPGTWSAWICGERLQSPSGSPLGLAAGGDSLGSDSLGSEKPRLSRTAHRGTIPSAHPSERLIGVSHRGLKGKRACHWLSKALEFYRGKDLCLMREGLLPSNASPQYPTGLGKQRGKLKWGWEQGGVGWGVGETGRC